MTPSDKAKLERLERGVELLTNALNSNSGAFQDAFHETEISLHILQRCINDMAKGQLVMVGEGADLRLDFPFYYRNYLLCMLMASFASWGASLAKEEATDTPEGAVVFGG